MQNITLTAVLVSALFAGASASAMGKEAIVGWVDKGELTINLVGQGEYTLPSRRSANGVQAGQRIWVTYTGNGSDHAIDSITVTDQNGN